MSGNIIKVKIPEDTINVESQSKFEKKINQTFKRENEINKVLQSLVKILKNIVSSNMAEFLRKNSSNKGKEMLNNDVFFSKHLPSVSIEDYFLRIIESTEISISTLILASIYIDRVCERTKFAMIPYNIYR